jgi:dolichol-phosphate mannosyltransferase
VWEIISKDDLTIVIPIVNEKEGVGKVLEELHEFGYEKVLVVDGYSTDGSREIAAKNGARVIEQLGRGKTGAVLTAVRQVKTPYMLVMDGDYTYDPSCIERMMVHGSEYNEIIGARTKGREHIPLINRLGNHLLNWFFRAMFAVRLSDVCSGMYLLKTKAARRLDLMTKGFDVEVEIASQFALEGSVAEVPVNYRSRLGEKKLSSFRHGLRIGSSIVRLANAYNPVLLYSGVIAIAIIPAAGILGWVVYERLFVSTTWHTGYATIAVLLFLLAAQAFSVATISILIQRSERRIRNIIREED